MFRAFWAESNGHHWGYESKVDGNVYSPSAYPPNWLLIA